MRTPPPNPLLTRADLQRAFQSLEAPLLANWQPDSSGPDLGPHRAWYDADASRLESVARYVWALAPFSAGGGASPNGWSLVLDAIVHGTDPAHPQYWKPTTHSNQRSVEMASFGVALCIAPKFIWDPLAPEQRDRFANWLADMVDKDLVPSNWQFFRLLVTMGLRHVGRAPKNADEMDSRAIQLIDSLYLSDGWYEDGKNGQRDYYIPMAFHFYGPLLAHLATEGPVTKRAAEWKARATEFTHTFVHWFGSDGAGLAFGRSLTYRFAQSAFFAASAVTGLGALAPGALKGMLLRNLRWWWKQPCLNPDGTLSLGYAYPNHNMLEPYNASGSPYWAFKAFAPLQLPADHPFWAAPEEPLDPKQPRSAQVHPRFLIDRDPTTGDVVALSAGQYHPNWPLRHRDAKYAKLAYSTRFGPTVGPNHEWLAGAGIDSTIAVLAADAPDGSLWQARGRTTGHRVTPTHVASDWSPQTGTTIRTWLVPVNANWHVRLHRITTDRAIQFAEGAFSPEDPTIHAQSDSSLCARGTDGSLTGLVNHSTTKRAPALNDVEPNSSLYHSRTKTPVLTVTLPAGTHHLVTSVFAAASGSTAVWQSPLGVTLDVATNHLTVDRGPDTISIDLRAND